MLEQQIERLNTNIERLIAVFGNGAPAAVATAAAVTPLTTATNSEAGAGTDSTGHTQPITVHDVQAALVALASKTGRGPAAAILSAFGAAKVGDLKPSDFAAAMAKIKEASKDGSIGSSRDVSKEGSMEVAAE